MEYNILNGRLIRFVLDENSNLFRLAQRFFTSNVRLVLFPINIYLYDNKQKAVLCARSYQIAKFTQRLKYLFIKSISHSAIRRTTILAVWSGAIVSVIKECFVHYKQGELLHSGHS